MNAHNVIQHFQIVYNAAVVTMYIRMEIHKNVDHAAMKIYLDHANNAQLVMDVLNVKMAISN